MRLRRGQGYTCSFGWEYTVVDTKTTSEDGHVWLYSHRGDVDFAVDPKTDIKAIYLTNRVIG